MKFVESGHFTLSLQQIRVAFSSFVLIHVPRCERCQSIHSPTSATDMTLLEFTVAFEVSTRSSTPNFEATIINVVIDKNVL